MENLFMTFPGIAGKGQFVSAEMILIRLGLLPRAPAS
jgi:hypothetical protein